MLTNQLAHHATTLDTTVNEINPRIHYTRQLACVPSSQYDVHFVSHRLDLLHSFMPPPKYACVRHLLHTPHAPLNNSVLTSFLRLVLLLPGHKHLPCYEAALLVVDSMLTNQLAHHATTLDAAVNKVNPRIHYTRQLSCVPSSQYDVHLVSHCLDLLHGFIPSPEDTSVRHLLHAPHTPFHHRFLSCVFTIRHLLM